MSGILREVSIKIAQRIRETADINCSGNAYPLGAAFYSNASYPETLKVVNISGVIGESFSLATGREQFNFNWTNGAIAPVMEPSLQFRMVVAMEIPRYIALWNTRFANYSVPGFKVSSIVINAEHGC